MVSMLMVIIGMSALASVTKGLQRPVLSRFGLVSRRCSTSNFDDDDVGRKLVRAKPGHVYFVATPIGNSGDISYRARDILSSADYICAEDTRHTIQLLRRISIPMKDLISHHEHNLPESIPRIIALVQKGHSVAVVSDAGSPGISDPGAQLAAALIDAQLPLHPIPGPSAVITALSVSGFPSSEYTFAGFLPVKGKPRSTKLALLADTRHTVVFFEAPHRMLKTFESLAALSPDMLARQVMCGREMTKKFEEFQRGTVAELLSRFRAQTIADAAADATKNTDSSGEIDEGGGLTSDVSMVTLLMPCASVNKLFLQGAKSRIVGEFTVVLGPIADKHREDVRSLRKRLTEDVQSSTSDMNEESTTTDDAGGPDSLKSRIMDELQQCLDKGIMRSAAVKQVSANMKVSRGIVYNLALSVKWT